DEEGGGLAVVVGRQHEPCTTDDAVVRAVVNEADVRVRQCRERGGRRRDARRQCQQPEHNRDQPHGASSTATVAKMALWIGWTRSTSTSSASTTRSGRTWSTPPTALRSSTVG